MGKNESFITQKNQRIVGGLPEHYFIRSCKNCEGYPMRPTIILNAIRKMDLEGVSRCSINVKDLVETANYVVYLEKQLREAQKEVARLDLLNTLKSSVPFEQYV